MSPQRTFKGKGGTAHMKNGGFIYDGTIEGYLSVVGRCISDRVMPVRIVPEYRVNRDVDTDLTYVYSDYGLADRIYKMIGRKSSPEVQQMVCDLFLTCLPDMEIDLFIFICKAIKYGARIADNFDDDLMKRVQFAIRDLYREAQSSTMNLSLRRKGDVFCSTIEPRNNILPVIRNKITSDPRYDDLIVFDRRHRLVLLRIGENMSLMDIKKLPDNGNGGFDDTFGRMWLYFSDPANIPPRDIGGRGADSLTRFWHIA